MHREPREQDYAANGTKIQSKGEKKFKAVPDDGFPLDCAFISGAVKKILKSTAITCDEGGDKGQWVIHTKTGGWTVNVETKRKIPFRRVGNTYFMDAWVRVPQKAKDKGKDDMEIDFIDARKPVSHGRDHDLQVCAHPPLKSPVRTLDVMNLKGKLWQQKMMTTWNG